MCRPLHPIPKFLGSPGEASFDDDESDEDCRLALSAPSCPRSIQPALCSRYWELRPDSSPTGPSHSKFWKKRQENAVMSDSGSMFSK